MRDFLWCKRSMGADADITPEKDAGRRLTRIEPSRRDPAVYFVEAVGIGLVKIGTVMKVSRIQPRMREIQAGCPFPLRVVFMIDGAGRTEESRLHRAFDHLRHDREWFRRDGDLGVVLDLAKTDPDEAMAIILRSIS